MEPRLKETSSIPLRNFVDPVFGYSVGYVFNECQSAHVSLSEELR